jgi:predicted alpha/beta hydrolase
MGSREVGVQINGAAARHMLAFTSQHLKPGEGGYSWNPFASSGRRFTVMTAAILLVAITSPALTDEPKYKPISVNTPDGLTISAQEWGNTTGPEILFIHGFSQSYMSWMRQFNSDLAKEFHIVTYDLRGHGNSDKPLDPKYYLSGGPHATARVHHASQRRGRGVAA